MALLFPDLEDEQEKDEEEEDYYDNVEEWNRKVEEEDYYYIEVELATVTNSLCEEKMNFTLHPGQMCAGGEEGRDYCQGELKTSKTVLQKLTSSDKVRAKQSLSLWWFVGKYTMSKILPELVNSYF